LRRRCLAQVTENKKSNVKIYLSQRHTGEKLKDIGACFGVDESGVYQANRRV
jgi:hypothetical protein